MNHPNSEDWMELLFGEIPAPRRAQLETHLASCGECRDRLKQWKAARSALDQWPLPEKAAARPRSHIPWMAAVAAMVCLFAGVSVGRWLGPAAPGSAQWQAAVRDEMGRQMPGLLADAVEKKWTEQARHLQARLATLSQDHQQTRQTVEQLQTKQAEELGSIQNALLELETKRVRDDFRLRQALETVAMYAEGGLQQAQAELIQLATHQAQAQTP